MTGRDQDFEVRPGRSRDRGDSSGRQAGSLAAQVRRAAAKAGHTRLAMRSRSGGTGTLGRGRIAAAAARFRSDGRRVVIKARVVRHHGHRFRAAPLGRHIDYLAREGVTRDGRDAVLFDQRSERVDASDFARRCEDDRHHFRFIVSPQDAADMEELRVFTRELMTDMASDLGTKLDWVGIDHWNTDNPHIHILLRGRADDGTDLVIDRDYISEGLRARAEARVTLELGPRSRQEIEAALSREVEAERWTSLDRRLQQMSEKGVGVVDLRPTTKGYAGQDSQLLLGRAASLERMALATRIGPAVWTLKPGFEQTLRDLAIRTDIIKTMHRALTQAGRVPDLSAIALHEEQPGNRATSDPVLGRLVARGLHDELTGTAFAIVEGTDGRAHHLRFADLELTGDAPAGAIVELRSWRGKDGRDRLSLATRSDLPLNKQIGATGATWIDRQLVSREPLATANGFGREVRDAMAARRDHLVDQGIAKRRGTHVIYPSGMIANLKARELDDAVARIARRTGLTHQPSAPGDIVSGLYRERVTLTSGRFAMIDDGLGFQLVPWKPALDQQIGRQILGSMAPGGRIDWSPGRNRGLGL